MALLHWQRAPHSGPASAPPQRWCSVQVHVRAACARPPPVATAPRAEGVAVVPCARGYPHRVHGRPHCRRPAVDRCKRQQKTLLFFVKVSAPPPPYAYVYFFPSRIVRVFSPSSSSLSIENVAGILLRFNFVIMLSNRTRFDFVDVILLRNRETNFCTSTYNYCNHCITDCSAFY